MFGIGDVIILLTASLAAVSASPPAFVWASRNLHIDIPSLGETLNKNDFQNRVAAKIFKAPSGTNVALFVQPRLSFPDLLSYGSEKGTLANLRRFVSSDYHAVTFDRVSDPISAFDSPANNRVNVVDVSPQDIEEKLQHSNPNFVNVFKIVLPDITPDNAAETLRSNDALIGEVIRKLQRVNHPFVGIYTGEASADEPSVHAVHKRAVEAGADNLTHLWESPCIKVYFESIEVRVVKNGELLDPINLETKPTVESNCDNNKKPNTITAVYKEADGKTVRIRLGVISYGKPVRGWQLSSVEVAAAGKSSKGDFTTNDTLKTPADAWASPGFSFHCSAPKMFLPIISDDEKDKAHAKLQVKEMQIQGLMKGETKPFGSAFDCVGFFSVPIFIGLLTTLLLIFFTTFAVVAMASIKTPERFDDPKGQKISVPNE